MKKFNSILAMVAVALTSVFGFTSGDKNDNHGNQETKQVSAPMVMPVDFSQAMQW